MDELKLIAILYILAIVRVTLKDLFEDIKK